MITFRYALCIALATALSPLTASQDSRSYFPSRSGNNQQPMSSRTFDSSQFTFSSSSIPSQAASNTSSNFSYSQDNDSGNESENDQRQQIPAGHAANRDTCSHNNRSSCNHSQEQDTQYFGMLEGSSYSTPFSSAKEACEPMSAKEEDMFGLLKADLSLYTDKNLMSRPVCSLPLEKFKELAQRIASRIVCEKVEETREKAADDLDTIIKEGIDALQDNQKRSCYAAKAHKSLQDKDFTNYRNEASHDISIIEEDTSADIDEIRFVVAKIQADIELNVARELLPISFHWNILPTSHKCGIGAAVLFAGVGIYNTIKHFFGSKAPQYDPELVDAAVNQEAHA